jgi:resuscitation-promoting factor RpfB
MLKGEGNFSKKEAFHPMLSNARKISDSLRKNFTVTASSFIAFSATTGLAGYEIVKDDVTLTVNGKKQEIRTHAKTVKELLQEQNIKPRKEDYVYPSLNTPITDDLNIVWEASKEVTLTIDGKKQKIWTTAKTVDELLNLQHIQIGQHDKVAPALDKKIKKGMEIHVEKAFPVQLNVGGKQQQVWATSTTVADFLKQQNVKLGKLDRVEPSLQEKIKENMVVKVIKVEKVTDVVEEPVDFAVVTKQDPTLPKGERRVIHPGEKGLVAKTYEIVLENGKEVARKLIAVKQIKNSKTRIVAIGTKVVERRSANVQNRPTSRGQHGAAKEFYVTATAYTAYCEGCSGITRTGINLRRNPSVKVIAVDPNIIPLGSKVYVEGYGYAIAADTGSGINGYEIDVFLPERSDAIRWGRKRVKIKVLQ